MDCTFVKDTLKLQNHWGLPLKAYITLIFKPLTTWMWKMKPNALSIFLLITIIIGIATSTIVYYGWYFDDFLKNSTFQGVFLLVALVFTFFFFSYFTFDFLRHKDKDDTPHSTASSTD